jgi:hypothetical protein
MGKAFKYETLGGREMAGLTGAIADIEFIIRGKPGS